MITDDVLADAYQHGLTLEEVADCAGISLTQCRLRIIRAGHPLRGRNGHTDERYAYIEHMLRSGKYTTEEIGAINRCSYRVVQRVAQNMRW